MFIDGKFVLKRSRSDNEIKYKLAKLRYDTLLYLSLSAFILLLTYPLFPFHLLEGASHGSHPELFPKLYIISIIVTRDIFDLMILYSAAPLRTRFILNL